MWDKIHGRASIGNYIVGNDDPTTKNIRIEVDVCERDEEGLKRTGFPFGLQCVTRKHELCGSMIAVINLPSLDHLIDHPTLHPSLTKALVRSVRTGNAVQIRNAKGRVDEVKASILAAKEAQ